MLGWRASSIKQTRWTKWSSCSVWAGQSPVWRVGSLKSMNLTIAISTKTFEFCAREATQIFGGLAYSRGGQGEKVERLYREVRAYRYTLIKYHLLIIVFLEVPRKSWLISPWDRVSRLRKHWEQNYRHKGLYHVDSVYYCKVFPLALVQFPPGILWRTFVEKFITSLRYASQYVFWIYTTWYPCYPYNFFPAWFAYMLFYSCGCDLSVFYASEGVQ